MPYRNVLLIDDDDDDQEIFFTALNQVAASVIFSAISNAGEALQKLKDKEITPDVIFLDLNMPIMNGQQFLIEIKKNVELANIPVIVFSTTSHLATIELTRELGAHDFITKPDKFDDLIAIFKSVFA